MRQISSINMRAVSYALLLSALFCISLSVQAQHDRQSRSAEREGTREVEESCYFAESNIRVAFSSTYTDISQESLLILRTTSSSTSSPIEYVLHYHGVPPSPHSDKHSDGTSYHRNHRHKVHMHANEPRSLISIKEGDDLLVAHTSFLGLREIQTLRVPKVGEWFAVHWPRDSSVQDSAATLKFMLIKGASGPQLLVMDYDEYVMDANEHNLGRIFPHEFKNQIRSVKEEERAEKYKEFLKGRWPNWEQTQQRKQSEQTQEKEL